MSDIPIEANDLPNRRLLAEMRKWDAEFLKLQAEQSKLTAEGAKFQAEQSKLAAEAAKLNRDRSVVIVQVCITGMGAGAAIFAAGATFWKIWGGVH